MNATPLRLLPTAREPEPRRTCGDCKLCCKVLAVQALDKPRGKWCQHASAPSAGGCCSIYDERPKQCQDFLCLWLLVGDPSLPVAFLDAWKDVLTLEERPDKIRGVFTPFAGGVRHPKTGKMLRAVAFHEGTPEPTAKASAAIVRFLEIGFAVLRDAADRCLGVWLPPEPESPAWIDGGLLEGGKPGTARLRPGWSMASMFLRFPTYARDSRLFDSHKASPEEKARAREIEDKARAEINAEEEKALQRQVCERLGKSSEELVGEIEVEREQARKLGLLLPGPGREGAPGSGDVLPR